MQDVLVYAGSRRKPGHLAFHVRLLLEADHEEVLEIVPTPGGKGRVLEEAHVLERDVDVLVAGLSGHDAQPMEAEARRTEHHLRRNHPPGASLSSAPRRRRDGPAASTRPPRGAGATAPRRRCIT